jgi:DoxX-like family
MSAQMISPMTEGYMSEGETTGVSTAKIWISRILKAVAVLFLVMDGGMKLFKPPFVVQSTVQLGYPESTIVGIGVALLVCSLLYATPRTSVLGAIFLTGYLGGAVASNIRAATPLFNVAFPLLFAVLLWIPLVLRNRRLASILVRGE